MKQSTETGDKTGRLRSKPLNRLDKAKRLFFRHIGALALGALAAVNPAAASAENIIGRASVTCVPLDRDRYGRIVARCFSAGQDIAAWSVANGWALAWARYSTEYLPLQVRAESLSIGIWSGTFEDPQAVRKRN